MADEAKKEALKALRESRKKTVEAARERIKENNALRKRLTEALAGAPKTVPEIAEQTGIPAQEVLWHLTSMKKYGKVEEGDQSGDYFKYSLLTE